MDERSAANVRRRGFGGGCNSCVVRSFPGAQCVFITTEILLTKGKAGIEIEGTWGLVRSAGGKGLNLRLVGAFAINIKDRAAQKPQER